jgi:hypothetical protein
MSHGGGGHGGGHGGGGSTGPVVGTTIANGFLLVGQTTNWNIWAPPSNYIYNGTAFFPYEGVTYPQFITYLTSEAFDYLDSVVSELADDFDYTIFPIPKGGGLSYDGVRLDAVLDPSAEGGAHTGTTFGGYGVSISPDAIFFSYDYDNVEIPQFWWFIFMCHETVNVWTGVLAGDWIWADGSPLWSGQSPFPNMVDIIVSGQLGFDRGTKDVSDAQRQRFQSDPGVLLMLSLQSTYGWKVFQRLFAYTQSEKITNWGAYAEPLRTAIIIWFLSKGAGLKASNTTLLTQFNTATQAISGQTVPLATYQQAQSMFPNP